MNAHPDRAPAGPRIATLDPRTAGPPHVVAITTNRWDGQWMNRQHLTWALQSQVPVCYVEEPPYISASLRTPGAGLLRPRISQPTRGLTVLRPPGLAGRRYATGRWNRATAAMKSRLVRHVVARRPGPLILYIWEPDLWFYADLLQPDFTAYHLYDWLEEYDRPLYSGDTRHRWFRRACDEADLVIAGTRQQAARMSRADVAVLPNGVAWDWYTRPWTEPDDLAVVGRPRVGYVGRISEKLDLSWMERLAAETAWQIILVGPKSLDGPAARRFDELSLRPNVHYLGSKPAALVPDYIRGLDIGLMSYTRGLHCEHASPLKLYEYCAGGLPIVSSRLASLADAADLQPFLRFADTPEQAAAAVADALCSGVPAPDRARRLAFAERHSWDRAASRVLDAARSGARSAGLRPAGVVRGQAAATRLTPQEDCGCD